MNALVLGLIRLYAVFLRPMVSLFGSCRYYPSCSDYAAESVRRHGAALGCGKALWRLLRCHPFSRGGVDLP